MLAWQIRDMDKLLQFTMQTLGPEQARHESHGLAQHARAMVALFLRRIVGPGGDAAMMRRVFEAQYGTFLESVGTEEDLRPWCAPVQPSPSLLQAWEEGAAKAIEYLKGVERNPAPRASLPRVVRPLVIFDAVDQLAGKLVQGGFIKAFPGAAAFTRSFFECPERVDYEEFDWLAQTKRKKKRKRKTTKKKKKRKATDDEAKAFIDKSEL